MSRYLQKKTSIPLREILVKNYFLYYLGMAYGKLKANRTPLLREACNSLR